MTYSPEFLHELRRPDCYPDRPERVEIVHTHVSVVCLAGESVYKLKKPLVLPFLDYSTLERRRFACEEEVRLNRRLCPGLYLGVMPLARDGVRLRFGGDGEVVDFAVHMRRLPEERMLDRLLAAGLAGPETLDALAGVVVAFHARARRGPDVAAAGDPAALAEEAQANFDACRPHVPGVFPEELLAAAEAASRAAFRQLVPVLRRRREQGRVVEGHGDLHARNVCVVEPIQVYDCIEFAAGFRCLDTAAEHAFLAMDLRHRGHPALAWRYLATCARLGPDPELLAIVPPLVAYRAMVRAKVAALALAGGDLGATDRDGARRSALRHLRLAAAALVEARGRAFVVVLGVPASGKSHLAACLAEATGWPLLATDPLRKELAGVAPTARAVPGLYDPAMSDRVYATLLERAERAARPPVAVAILDGNFATRARRAEAVAMARSAGARVLFVPVAIAESVALARLAERARRGDSTSDADLAVYRRRRAEFEPCGTEGDAVLPVDGAEAAERNVDRILARLLA